MKRFVFLLMPVLLLASACQTKKEVARVWDFIQERPDSALTALNAMDASRFHGRTLAEYRLLMAMALDKNYVDVASDSLALPAWQYFRKHGPEEKEIMSQYYRAVSHYYAHDDAGAVLLLEGVSEAAEQVGLDYYAGFSHILKSHAYESTYCVSEAVISAERGVASFAAIPDSFQVRRAKLQLADTYLGSKEFRKALDLFQELIKTCPTDTFTMRRALVHGAYCMYLDNPESADSAMQYYERALRDYSVRFDIVEAAHFGEVSCMAGDINQAYEIVSKLKSVKRHPEQRAFLEYQLFKKDNKPWEALNAVEEYHFYHDSVVVSALEQSLIKSQRNFQEQQKQAARHSLFLTRVIGSIGILVLLFILFILALHFVKKRKIAAQERAELMSSMEETVRMLSDTRQKNTDLEQELQDVQTRYVAAFKKQFSKISSLLANYYATSGSKNGRDLVYKQVMDIAAVIGNDQTRMSALERDVNAALDNAMKWYREEFPGKGVEHYRMVCLFMAGFATPMIEILTSIPKNTLYSKKSRLLVEIQGSNAPHKELFLIAIK